MSIGVGDEPGADSMIAGSRAGDLGGELREMVDAKETSRSSSRVACTCWNRWLCLRLGAAGGFKKVEVDEG